MRRRVLLSILVVGCLGCVPKKAFVCTTDGQCGSNGRCESVGYCSFPDPICTDGRRFGDYSGAFADLCVGGPGPDGGGGADGPIITGGCWAQLSLGDDFGCARKTGGQVWCWGNNDGLQLAIGDYQYHSTPLQVPGLSAKKISSGGRSVCAIDQNQKLLCWGANGYGQLGNGNLGAQVDPTEIPSLAGALDVSCGYLTTCAVAGDGTVWCFGDNSDQEAGDFTGNLNNHTAPFQVPGVTGAAQVSVGNDHACARTASGVLCWGANDAGALGTGDTTTYNMVKAPLLTGNVVELSAGAGHTCARLDDGSVWCWGGNNSGQLGIGGTTDTSTPTKVTGLGKVVRINAHGDETCAVDDADVATCWGYDAWGQLGDNQHTYSVDHPVQLSTGATDVSTGSEQSCVLTTDGKIACVGADYDGQLGDGTLTGSLVPIQVTALLNGGLGLAAGEAHACLHDGFDNEIRCWGANDYGQLGDDSETQSSLPGVIMSGANTSNVWGNVFAGGAFTCGWNGSVYCFGQGSEGELGNALTSHQTIPVEVSGITTATTMSSGYQHTCAILTGGTITCWGQNGDGQLGDGTTMNRSVPVVPALDGVVDVAAGYQHTCAIKTGGTGTPGVYCWGLNDHHQLGMSATADVLTPTPIDTPFPTLPVQITAGTWHTCVRFDGPTGGKVQCWGSDGNSELGDNGGGETPTPVDVYGLTDAMWISARDRSTCAVRYDGSAVCWGLNDRGQLGDGTIDTPSVPVAVQGLSGMLVIARGGEFTCGSSQDGKVYCWGTNEAGQLGQGTVLDKTSLVTSLANCP
jgi:alpha-tubulin suppressor-like RCC1 family protein